MKLKLLVILLAATAMASDYGPFTGINAPNPFGSGSNDLQFLDYFTGEWTGEETGAAGIGRGERTYEWIMNGKYLFQKNRSVFEPQEKNPGGEAHEDWAFFSFDKPRNKIVLREFHNEGFVNRYILDELSKDGKTVTFVSEQIENGSPGMKARCVFTAIDQDEFTETFELAMAGGEFKRLLANRWKRRVE